MSAIGVGVSGFEAAEKHRLTPKFLGWRDGKAATSIEPPWELTTDRPRSLSGVKLEGTNLVRLIYMDESGTGKEQSLVVAGIIIHGDSQLGLVEGYINDLVNHYIPKEHQEGWKNLR